MKSVQMMIIRNKSIRYNYNFGELGRGIKYEKRANDDYQK